MSVFGVFAVWLCYVLRLAKQRYKGLNKGLNISMNPHTPHTPHTLHTPHLPHAWQCGTHLIPLAFAAPCVQGILNVTPDSFSDGALHLAVDAAVARGLAMVAQGASIIDIGGESTRPNYVPVSAELEIARIVPVIAALSAQGVCISVDTHKPRVMQAALAAGASIVNDVNALCGVDDSGSALEIVLSNRCGIVLMDGFSSQSQAHKRAGMGLFERLQHRYTEVLQAGIAPSRTVIDAGIGFDKTLADNLACVQDLPQLNQLSPVLIGGSRKSMLGLITGRAVEARMPASVALALLAAQNGAAVLRVHDVAPTVDALKVWQALR
jgi:dihydropteroate synthase